MRWTYFNVETGRISKVETRPASNPPILKDGVDVVEGHFDEHLKWIDNGEVKDRPALDVAPPALVAGGSWQVSLPIGTEIAVVAEDGATETTATTDAEMVEIAFEDAGQWALRLTPPFPYQPAEISIEVTDAD